jgi:hypothetical protein
VSLDGGAHAGASGTDDEDVVLGFHSGRTLSDADAGRRQTRGPAAATASPASAANCSKFSRNFSAR